MDKIKAFIENLSKKQKYFSIAAIVVIVVFVSIFSVFSINTSSVTSKSTPVVFEVFAGDSLDSVTTRLEKQGIIKNATFAKLSAKFGGGSELVAGQFKVNKNWAASKILKYLTKQENVMRNQVMLTFKEGIWAKDIAVIIEKNTNVSSEALINLWNDDTFLKGAIEKYDFLDDSIFNDQYRVKLEGYLFPQTYEFNVKTTPEEVTYTFLDYFQKEYDGFKKELKKLDWSLHDVITFASVVQYEASSVKDMKLVSGVFHNRLNQGKKMESSVTVCYSLYEFENWEECESNFAIASPYNTYQNEGLPIGPILNPGLEAIKAALEPTESEYLYFIADVHGDNTVYYAKTYEEHLKNQKKYLGY